MTEQQPEPTDLPEDDQATPGDLVGDDSDAPDQAADSAAERLGAQDDS